MLSINYEPVATKFGDGRALITVRTGTSTRFNNFLTVAKLRDPVTGIALERGIMKALADLSNRDASNMTPNVPMIDVIETMHDGRWIDLAVVSSLVTNGARQRKLIAEYRFVVVMASELAEALDAVCELERVLKPDEPPMIERRGKVKAAR